MAGLAIVTGRQLHLQGTRRHLSLLDLRFKVLSVR
jgi:hypothetical protein